MAASSSRWKTPLVVVVASYDGICSNAPWLVNTTQVTFVVYQRKFPRRPNYVPNIGFEGGVYIRFVLDNYDDLPNQTAFVQEQAEMHNRAWLEWTSCLLPNASYTPLVYVRVKNNDFRLVKDGYHAIAEQCWRNFIHAFGKSSLLPPNGAKPTHAYYGGALFTASRAQLQRSPRIAYARIDMLTAGGDGRCHVGELDWANLYAKRSHHPKTVLHDEGVEAGKHTQAQAIERLSHALFGNFTVRAPFKFDWCATFAPSHTCFGSPCHRRSRGRASNATFALRGIGHDATASSGSTGEGGSTARRARWYLLPFRGHHKRFAHRQEVVLEAAWQRRVFAPFGLNVTFQRWNERRSARHDEVFNVSLLRMVIWLVRDSRGQLSATHGEFPIRRLEHVAPAWWLPGRQACGFDVDGPCNKYNARNKLVDATGRLKWNRTTRAAAARQGTVMRSHSLDLIREIA